MRRGCSADRTDAFSQADAGEYNPFLTQLPYPAPLPEEGDFVQRAPYLVASGEVVP